MTDVRFSGVERLVGKSGFSALQSAHVCIVGIGGVGSWVAEALARSGVGMLTLVDMDEVCVTNVNRQVHAGDASVGKSKIVAMRERIMSFAPACEVIEAFQFYNADNAEALLANEFSYVVDAIDSIPHKCHLLNACWRRGTPVITVGGAGGRRDPGRIQVVDLTRTFDDPLLQRVRKKLRQKFGFPRNTKKKWKIPAVFSPEPVVFPQSDGSVCETREEGSQLRLDCASGYGTACFVTGAFGFAAAAKVVEDLCGPHRVAVRPHPGTRE